MTTGATSTRPTSTFIRALALLVVVAGGIAVALIIGVPPLDEIRAWVGGAGWTAPVLFAVLYAGLTLTPAPATITSITAGVLFGLPVGIVVVMTGAVAGAALGFAIARVLGRDAVTRFDNLQRQRLDALLRRRGLVAVIGIRLVPLLPFAAVNYACGLSALRPRDYLLGTAVGILPSATAYVAIGAYGATPGSTPFLLAVSGVAVLTVAGVIAVRRRRKGEAAPSQPAV
jgi:uncharacterized membrane protein YdjX (TVP38/TMEM64 family)